jgi:hypothetical protein
MFLFLYGARKKREAVATCTRSKVQVAAGDGPARCQALRLGATDIRDQLNHGPKELLYERIAGRSRNEVIVNDAVASAIENVAIESPQPATGVVFFQGGVDLSAARHPASDRCDTSFSFVRPYAPWLIAITYAIAAQGRAISRSFVGLELNVQGWGFSRIE